jgi:hypothetical protein
MNTKMTDEQWTAFTKTPEYTQQFTGVNSRWTGFKKEFEKTYASLADEKRAFRNFLDNTKGGTIAPNDRADQEIGHTVREL